METLLKPHAERCFISLYAAVPGISSQMPISPSFICEAAGGRRPSVVYFSRAAGPAYEFDSGVWPCTMPITHNFICEAAGRALCFAAVREVWKLLLWNCGNFECGSVETFTPLKG